MSTPPQEPFRHHQAPPPPPPMWQYPTWQQQAPPKPGTIPLRPLTVGDILGGAFATIRRHWRVMVVGTLVIALVTQAIQLPLARLGLAGNPLPFTSRHGLSPAEMVAWVGRVLSAGAMSSVGAVLLTVLTIGLLTVATGRAVIGAPVSLGEALRSAASRLLPLIGLYLVAVVLLVLVFALPAALGLGVGAALGGTAAVVGLTALGAVVGLVGVVYLAILFSQAVSVLILERAPVFRALSRSRGLVRGQWWRVFGILLLGGLIVAVFAAVLRLPVTIWQANSAFSAGLAGNPNAYLEQVTSWPVLIVGGVATVVTAALTTPFTTAVSVLLYHDLRIRADRFDITLAQMAATPSPSQS